jgi:glycosyltransferase involved in cell wall biosynthesis
MCRVSVIITVFNGEKKIKKCLESVLRQTYKNLEIVIFDDGSIDGTRAVINRFIADNQGVLFNFNFVDQNIGRSAALNRCLDVAKGEYFAIMDADDEMYPQRIARQIELLDRDPSVSVVGGAQIMQMSEGIRKINRAPLSDRLIKAGLFVRTTMLHPTVMFRKSFLELHKIRYDLHYFLCEDYKIFVDLLYAGARFANISDVVNTYDYSTVKSWDGSQDQMVIALRRIWADNLARLSIDVTEDRMATFLKITRKLKPGGKMDGYYAALLFFVCTIKVGAVFGGKFAFAYARLKDIKIIMKSR